LSSLKNFHNFIYCLGRITPDKFASPLLNTLCCHWHEFNLAGLFSTKNLTGQAGLT